MSRIITFLGQPGAINTTLAIATAQRFAQQQKRVLLITHTPNPASERLLGCSLTSTPQELDRNLEVVQLQTTALLEQVWDEVKKWLSSYIPDSLAIEVYSSEVVILPGFDSILAFNALRKYYQSEDYDLIVYDGRGDLEVLRMLGIPDMMGWYFRRFRQVFESLDLSKIAESIGGPIASALLAANMDSRKVKEGFEQIRDWIARGVAVVGDPKRLTAYLVTTAEPDAIALAQWFWGSAQQVNLSVSGVLFYTNDPTADLRHYFDPLDIHPIPILKSGDWKPLVQALPDFDIIPAVPQPVAIDVARREVRVFLPGFTKQQVKLTQFGKELTVEAGDQRRNIALPAELQGYSVTSGRFEAPYLLISF